MDDSLECIVTERKVYSTKADIRKFYSTLDKYEQFKLIDDDVCLDPDDEDNYFMYMNFRSKSGARLDRSIATNDFILVGNDKCGVSAVLDIPVPPGASLSIKMSTWCNPCHSGFRVEKSQNFGVGMVPYGEGKENEWIRGNTNTCIENGIQLRADIEMMFSVNYIYKVMQQGRTREYFSGKRVQLDIIDVRICYDNDNGEFELSFTQGADTFKIKCPAKDDNPNMQLYFNCLGWADNNTYIQIHEVIYEPSNTVGNMVSTLNNEKISAAKRDRTEIEETIPDYNKMLKADPELQAKVNATIKLHTQQLDD